MLTHRQGCEIAAKALKTKFNCGAVFIESMAFSNSESPDAIGFRQDGCSILMEVKITRSDFLSDKNKPHRKNPETGMGSYRFYVCPEGIIKPEDLPPKWGLFYFTNRGSVKPVVTPVNYSALYSIEQYGSYYEGRGGIYHTRIREMIENFGFKEKNHVAESNIIYGAWRQMCIAQKEGLPYTVCEVHNNPLKRPK